MAKSRRTTARRTGKNRQAGTRHWSWKRVVAHLMLWGTLLGGAWVVWIDYQVRTDFKALQWALPARIYARPVELYAGAHIGDEDLVSYLQRLGYRETSRVAGPGEYTVEQSLIR